jgi:hypothetical protein
MRAQGNERVAVKRVKTTRGSEKGLMENQLMELVVCHMARLMLYKSIMA